MRNGTQYSLLLPPAIEEELEDLTSTLNISKGAVIRRSLHLLKYAVEADEILLRKKQENGEEMIEQTVVIQ